MLEHVLYVFQFNLNYLKTQVAEIPEEKMANQPKDLPNHPAWTLGHVATSCALGASFFGVEMPFSKNWIDLYKKGSTPLAERQSYPSKAELLKTLEQQHKILAEAISNADPKLLTSQLPDETRRQRFPKTGDFICFLMTAHESIHIGQLADWRRAMGMDRIT